MCEKNCQCSHWRHSEAKCKFCGHTQHCHYKGAGECCFVSLEGSGCDTDYETCACTRFEEE